MGKRPERAFENDADDLDEDEREGSAMGEGKGEVKNPRMKQLSDEAAQRRREAKEWRKRAEDAEAQLALHQKGSPPKDDAGDEDEDEDEDEQESSSGKGKKNTGDSDTVRTLRLELSFERLATKAKVRDIEAAWKLVGDDIRAVTVDDDGVVDAKRMGEIVDHVVERYPYLRDDYAPSTDEASSLSPSGQSTSTEGASGRPMNGRRKQTGATDFGALSKKFPALRR